MARVAQIPFGAQEGPQPTRQQIQRLQMAQALMQQGSSSAPVQTPLEGLGRASQAWAGALMDKREQAKLDERRAAYGDDMAAILKGASAKPWVNPDTGQQMGTAGGLAGALATADRLQTPEARTSLAQMQLAQALNPQAQPEQFSIVPAEEAAALGLPPGVWQRSPSGEIKPAYKTDAMSPEAEAQKARIAAAGRTNVSQSVASGPQGPQVGTIPQGYQLEQTPEGAWRMAAIPGGPAAAEAEAAARKAAGAKASEQQAAGIVFEDIGRLKKKVTDSPRLTTGFFGNILKDWAGTPAADAKALIDTIGANISFDKLNEMRANSPTGGALGNVTERELELLSATLGSLSQAQSQEQFLETLGRLEQQYGEVVHGPGWKPGGNPGNQELAAPPGVDPADWQYMTPEERALFQ